MSPVKRAGGSTLRPKAARPRTETQQRIVDAALALFAERGFDGTTTAELARRAKVTEKTLFSHFRSKQALFAEVAGPALLATLEPVIFERLRQTLETPEPTFEQAVRAVARERLSFARTSPDVLKLVAQEVLMREEFRAPLLAHWRESLMPAALQLIERAKSRGELRAIPSETVLRVMVSLVVAFALEVTVLAPAQARDAEAELDRVLDVFLHGVLRPVRGRSSLNATPRS